MLSMYDTTEGKLDEIKHALPLVELVGVAKQLLIKDKATLFLL